MSMTKREWQTAEEKAYLDAVLNSRGSDAIMKSIKDLEAVDRRRMKETDYMKVLQRFMWGGLILVALFIGAQVGEMLAKKDMDQAYKQGWKDALYKRPVSEDLEMVCAGLWVGQENAKYIEQEMRQNAKRTNASRN